MKKNLLAHNQNYINRWIITYADFITMLLALFMVMYALSQMDINNLKEFSKSMGKEFNLPATQNSPEKMQLNENYLQQVFQTTQTSVTYSEIDASTEKNSVKELKQKLSGFESTIDKEAVEFENIKNIVKEKLNNVEGVSIARAPRGLLISLNNAILFDPGSDIIRLESVILLDKIAGVLKSIPNSIRIEGHTDNIPIKTSKIPSNWELSTLRATNIIRYLVNKHNFSPGKLSAVGYGEYMPIADNSSKEGRATNRRIDIVVLSSSSKIFNP
ncbi:MAG TPA: OmpA family protein [Candidatus Gastranaerophilales bacterium]|nr:OmpA family protein [Candidatus Gastranaerophilales bacterium]